MAKGIKTGGRQEGTPNKVTSEIRDAFQKLIEQNIDNLSLWINEIATKDPAKALTIIIELSEFIVPKLSRTELNSKIINDFNPDNVKITFK
jgi:hypothetical protein